MQKDLTLFGQFASALRNADLDIAIVKGLEQSGRRGGAAAADPELSTVSR